MNRLPPQPGERIDRQRPIAFRFEGQQYEGLQGDVLSSALWANGVRLAGRSFKYHRPRGSYTFCGYDANVIVENGTDTNMRGDLLPVVSGMDVRSVNTLGGLARDRYRTIERFSSFLPVGFYYKAFHTPRRLFRYYENTMRRAAGLGRVSPSFRGKVLPKQYAFCDLLIVGSGPTGLSAAAIAAELGLHVLLVDEQTELGGSLCWQQAGPARREQLVARVRSSQNVEIRLGTQAAGWYADQWVALVDDQRLTKLRTRATLFATGCIEQPAVFHNNDRPGVILGSAAQRLIRLYAVKPFEKAVILAANDDGYRAAIDLIDVGVEVPALVDLRAQPVESELAADLRRRGIPIQCGHAIYSVNADAKHGAVKGATICPLNRDGSPNANLAREYECDGVVMSVGWGPNSGLAAQAGVRFRYDPAVEQLVPKELPSGVFTAGRMTGVFQLEDRLADGRRAALAAASFLGRDVEIPPAVIHHGPAPTHPFPIVDHPRKKNFVDLDEDLQLVDLVNSHAEGYDSVELLKRYSTIGMGPSQGKLSNMNAVRVLAQLNGQSLEQTGTTTARPFHQPVSIAHLAGRRFHPYRITPMDAWHRHAGAPMVHVGPWFRPEYYPVGPKPRDECILDEAKHLRRHVALIDLSTLGKVLINGSDAARFLEHVFAGSFTRQKVGRSRYALACDETGVVHEEGIVARLADDRFYVTASTNGAEAFYRELQRWAILFNLNVTLANATGHWAAMNVAGPDARRVLQPLVPDDLGPNALPFGTVREASVAGVPAVVIRSGFLGELSYEVHVPAAPALDVWNAILAAGMQFDIRPFGIEAQRLLRLEKGHPLVGHDTDALTTPFEAQLGWAVDMDKPFFVGKRSLQMLAVKPLARQLVGIEFDPAACADLPEECQLVIRDGEIVGRVTSIAKRTTIGRPIGMAYLRPELTEAGTQIHIRVSEGRTAVAQVARLPFYDPDNSRQLS